jgi:quinolinate synthase
MVEHARTTTASRVLIATEIGILHQLRAVNSATSFEPVNPNSVCRYMKMTTPASLLRSLREDVTEITVDTEVARRAAAAVRRMIEIGQPGQGGE